MGKGPGHPADFPSAIGAGKGFDDFVMVRKEVHHLPPCGHNKVREVKSGRYKTSAQGPGIQGLGGLINSGRNNGLGAPALGPIETQCGPLWGVLLILKRDQFKGTACHKLPNLIAGDGMKCGELPGLQKKPDGGQSRSLEGILGALFLPRWMMAGYQAS